jgi:hypothetical protein
VDDAEIPGGADISLIAHLNEDGEPALTPFANDVKQVDAGQARIIVRHTAAAPAVEVRAGAKPVFEGLTNPNEAKADLPRRQRRGRGSAGRYRHRWPGRPGPRPRLVRARGGRSADARPGRAPAGPGPPMTVGSSGASRKGRARLLIVAGLVLLIVVGLAAYLSRPEPSVGAADGPRLA